jgi:hypothetical protein
VLDDGDHAVGVVEGQSPKDDAIDDREDGGGRANARRQNTQGDKGKRGRFPETPNRGVEVVEQKVGMSYRFL